MSLMLDGMSHVATVGKPRRRLYLFAPYEGDVAAIDSHFGRLRSPGANFDPNSPQHNASTDKLEALGELLAERIEQRIQD